MLTYDLTSKRKAPKYQLLYSLIRDDIKSGVLPAGVKLPSRRAFAEHLGVSTATVDCAYRQLISEGYVQPRSRSGYYVCKMELLDINPVKDRTIRLSSDPEPDANDAVGFEYSAFSKLMREVITKYDRVLMQKSPHNGCAALRNAIAFHLLHFRGMIAQPENIVIGAGAEYLYGMIVQLLGRDKVYGIENPGYEKIRAVYEANGAKYELLALDDGGISSSSLENTHADVLHVTPFHSFPSGVTAPAAKRIEYLSWARERGAIIIEDDFDSEFAIRGMPPESLYSMDDGKNVIYLNTFSKSMSPAMRIGYMVLPPHLMREYERKLGFYSCTVPTYDQYLLAEYISGGYFERHLNRARKRLKAQGQK
ncbi:MAG: PLP-dependent aminotransferase family protein [Oscillospiraceae bacterium]|nr:PLP-dependent aminotransferase family protein [Oscillospiraceae bacterium]